MANCVYLLSYILVNSAYLWYYGMSSVARDSYLKLETEVNVMSYVLDRNKGRCVVRGNRLVPTSRPPAEGDTMLIDGLWHRWAPKSKNWYCPRRRG